MGGVVRRRLASVLGLSGTGGSRSLRAKLGVLFMCCVVAGPSWAASQRDKDDCNSNEPDRVIAGCSRIIQDRSETIKLQATAFSNRGSAHFTKGDFNRAIIDLTEAIRLDPKDTTAYNRRGLAYDTRGNTDRAIADYSEAIKLDAKVSLTYFNRARAYDKQEEADRAIADYTEAIRLDPNFAAAFASRGRDYDLKGDVENAIADYTAAIKLELEGCR